MRPLDEAAKKIVRSLVRDPRLSDNAISARTGVPVRTVSRRRKALEQDGRIAYFAALNMQTGGTGDFAARHLYIVKFRLGITVERILNDIRSEPKVVTVFTQLILESHVAEINGQVSLLLFIEGKDDTQIVESFQGKIVPLLLKNHGADSIQEVQTIRVLAPIRFLHNYLPDVNMHAGHLRSDWPDDGIFVG